MTNSFLYYWYLPVQCIRTIGLIFNQYSLRWNAWYKYSEVSFLQRTIFGFFFSLVICFSVKAGEPVALIISCPQDVTISCGDNTLPANTGNPSVTDPCDPTPTIAYYDYTITPPAAGSEMRWVLLPAGSSHGSCSSGTNCSTGTICLGLEYTPNVTGTLTSYTTGFFLNCFNGSNPITYNASCVMGNNSGVIDDCAGSGLLLMNSSGNSGTIPIKKQVPVMLHQVCLQLGPGGSVLFDEDEGTDLTTSIELQGGGLFTDLPAYTNYTQSYNNYCSGACQYPYTIYRKFVVTDDCNDLATCVQHINIQDITPPGITCPPNLTLAYSASTSPAAAGIATSTDLCDSSPLVTSTDVITTNACPFNYLITRTWKSTDDCGNTSTCVQTINVFDQGTICGAVHDDLGQPIGGVQIQLIADVNVNLVQDSGDTLVTTTTTNAVTGEYCFMVIRPCNYIILEIQPINYGSLSDVDATPDPDGNDSPDGPDDQIPVALSPGESDVDNNFIDIICPVALPSIPFDTICSGQTVNLQINNLNLGALTYSWNFGSGSTPGTGSGLGPHTVSYITTTQNQSNGASVVMTISKTGCTNLVGQVTLIDVNPIPNAVINTSTVPVCYYTNKIFQPVAPPIPGATYNWNFGIDAVPATATGYGPHTVYYTSADTKTVKLKIFPNEPGAQCPDSSSLSFLVNSCPAQILGLVKSNTNVPIIGATVKLFPDNDHNGTADNTMFIRSVTTNVNGFYVMATLDPGSYVIVETQPSGWITFDDYDASNDGDLATNISGTDNLIPVTLLPSELDSMNNFIELEQPGTITGNVFVDGNNNLVPDAGEGINMVTIKLFVDSEPNGKADSNTPVATQTTDVNGEYIFSSVAIGNYVLVENNKAGYFSIKDYDPTSDGDVIMNTNMVNDTIPVTMSNNEGDANNYYIDALICPLLVTNTNDIGYGSLRYNIDCANAGDTIRFHPSLSDETIWLTSQKINLTKNLVFLSTLTPRVTVGSSTTGLFSVFPNVTVEFRDLNLISGNVIGSEGAVFDNQGVIKLHNINATKNPSFPAVERLIRNQINSSLFLTGTCMLEN